MKTPVLAAIVALIIGIGIGGVLADRDLRARNERLMDTVLKLTRDEYQHQAEHVGVAGVVRGGLVVGAASDSITLDWDRLNGNPSDFRVMLSSGAGAGQMRAVVDISGPKLAIYPDWAIVPKPDDAYAIVTNRAPQWHQVWP